MSLAGDKSSVIHRLARDSEVLGTFQKASDMNPSHRHFPAAAVAASIAFLIGIGGLSASTLIDGFTTGTLPYHGSAVSMDDGAFTFVRLIVMSSVGFAVGVLAAFRAITLLIRWGKRLRQN